MMAATMMEKDHRSCEKSDVVCIISGLVLIKSSIWALSFENENRVMLHAKPVAWKETFETMTIDFKSASHGFTHRELRKRVDSTRSETAHGGDPVSSAAPSYPSVSASASAKQKIVQDFESKHINQKIIPPDVPLVDQLMFVLISHANFSKSLLTGFDQTSRTHTFVQKLFHCRKHRIERWLFHSKQARRQ